MKITTTLLRRKRACQNQIELFISYFPEGVVITESICLAHATEFDWDWAARKLLRPPARKASDVAMAPARKACIEAMAPAWKAYVEAYALAFARAAEGGAE